MKIAFVNQPIDTILPPYQTSVGACTYGVACAIADSCDVVVYGARRSNKGLASDFFHRNVNFRFLPFTWSDRVVDGVRHVCSMVGRITSPNSSSSWHFPDFGRQVAIDLQKAQCDVIHIQHCSPYVPVIRALNPSAKIVLHLHAEWFSQNNPALLRSRLQSVDLLTTVSEYVTEKTRLAYPAMASRCETTYNGIDAAEFRRERNYPEAGRSKEKLILYAGAISPHKGLHVLVEAFRLVVERYPNVRLKIIGPQGTYSPDETFDDNEDRTLLESLAPFYTKDYSLRLKARLSLAPADAGTYLSYLKSRVPPAARDKVVFAGLIPRPELIENYYAADVFAFPPIWNEGFGLPPLEAMAAGAPVVASRSGATTETIKDKETGYLVEKNDPRALASGILNLLENDDLAQRMGRAGRQRAMERFTWDRVAEGMYKRYQGLCGMNAQPESVLTPSFQR